MLQRRNSQRSLYGTRFEGFAKSSRRLMERRRTYAVKGTPAEASARSRILTTSFVPDPGGILPRFTRTITPRPRIAREARIGRSLNWLPPGPAGEGAFLSGLQMRNGPPGPCAPIQGRAPRSAPAGKRKAPHKGALPRYRSRGRMRRGVKIMRSCCFGSIRNELFCGQLVWVVCGLGQLA
jgi:hypothetical protein